MNPACLLANPHVTLGLWNLWNLSWQFGLGSWVYLAFLIWIAVWCVRNDPERSIWLWVILVFQPIGPLIYFFARWIPAASVSSPSFLKGLTRRADINRLRIAATQIGNPHQFIELGDALADAGQREPAIEAYEKALARDPRNTQALWGAGCGLFVRKEFDRALARLTTLLEIDPAYKFGDVSLLHAKALHATGRSQEARTRLEGHIRRWRHPEALHLLAALCADEGEYAKAREHLEAMIMDIEASPSAIARRHMFWRSRARRMLRRLPKSP
jgi:hypothetical protein